ncbi:FKBP-type peptidyl-prolyl cis-trans isomerase [Pontibacter sp. 172403-2]|nr:FKBP-type peptidyl-prolyl cis-trans isomerase [Pontibacter sp. 172403-2]
MQETASGIHYFVLTPGTGAQVKTGDFVEVHYLGKFVDKPTFDASTKFDSSYDRGAPLSFVVGASQVIDGWDEVLPLMTVGEEARFYIPSGLAYGPCPRQGAIPPNTVLSFDIKVLSAK